jgi:gamma-glutamylcyclotransferase (GGCT)/AIG2-like uncharacterized protein YtfP
MIVLYFAYGSNLWRQQMNARCPNNYVVGTGRLNGWRWVITTRGYASIVASKHDQVIGTVYDLSEVDVRNLDQYEGVMKGFYVKEMMQVVLGDSELSCLVYVDPVIEEGTPKVEYISRINHGIRDSGLPTEYVERYLRPVVPANL